MKSNRKKLLSLALVLGFAPGKGMTARAAVTFKDIAFDKEWTSNNTLPLGNGNYGAVHVVSGGTFTMYGGTIIGNRAERGGGVQNNGNFTLNDGTITGNISHVHGGGVCTRGGNSRTIIAGGTITKNVARRFGGGLNISGPTEMSGGTISDNEIKPRDEQGQTGGGGGVYVDNSFTLTGGTISGNKAVNNTDKNNQLGGGGILIGNGQLTLSGNTVIKNNSGINGYDDLYVPTGKTIAIGGELSGESIGVTMQPPGVFTNSTNTSFNDPTKFVSDNASYAVGKNADGQLFLGAPVTVTFDRAPLKTPARRHSGSFAAYLRCENLEIHKVFLRFSPSICGKISRCASRPGFLEVPFTNNGNPYAVNFRLQNGVAFRLDMTKTPEGRNSCVYRYNKWTAPSKTGTSMNSILASGNHIFTRNNSFCRNCLTQTFSSW